MRKNVKTLLTQIFSLYSIFTLVFQPLLLSAALLLPTAVRAQEVVAAAPTNVVASYNADSHEFTFSGSSAASLDYLLKYTATVEGKELEQGLTGTAAVDTGKFFVTRLAASCSGADCVPHTPTSGTLTFTQSDTSFPFSITDQGLWLESQAGQVISKIATGVEYKAPQNDGVSVKFTTLPAGDNWLVIKEITLTPEQMEELGSLSDKAYEFLTNMPNGSFTYDLQLPLNGAADQNVRIQYASSIDNLLGGSDSVAVIKTTDSVTVSGLDHFTVFVVTTDPGADCTGGVYSAGACYATLQAAIDAAAPGDTIEVQDGTYVLTSTLNVNEEVSIIGESEVGTIIDASANGASWGIRVSANNVTLKNLTVLPPLGPGAIGTSGGGGFPIHVSNVPSLVHNVTLENITIEDSNRTAFDLHGVEGGTLKNLTAKNSRYGNGLQLSGSKNVTVENFTSQDNAWGGLALYNSGPLILNRSTSDITLKGNTFSIAEANGIYSQAEHALPITNITVEGYDFKVTNDMYRPGAADYIHYQQDLTDATAFALALFNVPPFNIVNTASVIQQISTEDYYVAPTMEIARALALVAATHDVILTDGTFAAEDLSGTYADDVTVHSLTDAASSTVQGLNLTGSTFNGLIFDALTFTGDSSGYGNNSFTIAGNGSYQNLSITNSIFDGESVAERHAIFLNRGFDGFTLENNQFTGYNGSAIGTVYSVVFAEAQDFTPTGLGDNFVARGNSLTDSTATNFIEAFRWKNILMEQNTVTAQIGRLMAWAYDTDLIESVTIQNNTATVSAGSGVGAYYLNGVTTIQNNSVTGAATCLTTTGIADLTVTGNTLSNCTTRGLFFDDSDGYVPPVAAEISGNTFSTSPVGVENSAQTFELNICNNQFIGVTARTLSDPGPFAACTTIAPTNVGYNVDNGGGDTYAVPHPDTELTCGATTNINGVSHHWTDVASGSAVIKYQRQYQTPTNLTWSGNEIYPNSYSNFRTFGGGVGSVGTYNSRVRAFFDFNNNNILDGDEPTSEWSPNSCQITYDPAYRDSYILSGMKFNDLNGNAQNDSEPGLGGWTIKAVDATPAATLTVDSRDIAGTTSSLLPAGQYLFVVSGDWTNRNSSLERYDADFSTLDNWITHDDGLTGYGAGFADLQVNNGFVDWTPFAVNHEYLLNYTLDSEGTINFAVFDGPNGGSKTVGWYGDNNGTLQVTIYKVYDEMQTLGDGSYELTVPASATDIRLYELPQDGWYQTYPSATRYHSLTMASADVADLDFGNRLVPEYSDVMVCKQSSTAEPLEGWTVGLATATGSDISIPVNGTSAASQTLPAGDYVVFANGTYKYGSAAMIADAGYSYRPAGIPFGNNDWVSGDVLGTPGALEVKLNSANIDWTPFAPSHAYTKLMTGFAGGTVAVGNIYDSSYADNANNGNLRARFESVVHQGVTADNGCVTFTDVEYGEYAPFEVMQSDWEFASVAMNSQTYTTQPAILTVDAPEENAWFTNTYVGEVEPTATPTTSPSPTPTPSPTVEPTPTPTPTPPSILGASTTSSDGGGGGTTPASPPVCSDTKPSSAPNLQVVASGPNSVTLSWSSVSPVTHYALFFTGSNGGNHGASNIGNINSYTVDNLSGGVTYTFEVFGVNGCMPGDRSNTVIEGSALTGGPVIGGPTGPAGEVLGVDTEVDENGNPIDGSEEVESAGEVLGDSIGVCVNWKQYLPLIMLGLQLLLVILIEVFMRDFRTGKYIALGIASVCVAAAFYWLRDCDCSGTVQILGILCQWFWIVALFVLSFVRVSANAVNEE